MTVICVDATAKHPYTLADSALSEKSLFRYRKDMPLDRWSKKALALKTYSITQLAQKILRINDAVIVGCAGVMQRGACFISLMAESHDQLSTLKSVREFCSGFDFSSIEGTGRFIVLGLCIVGTEKHAFRYDSGDLSWQEGSRFVEGTGDHLFERIEALPIIRTGQPKDEFQETLDRIHLFTAYMMGHDSFTQEGRKNHIGGVYVGYAHNGTDYIRNQDFSAVFWRAIIAGNRELLKSGPPSMLNVRWAGDELIVRTHDQVGRVSRNLNYQTRVWRLPTLLQIGVEDTGFERQALIQAALDTDFNANTLIAVAEITCKKSFQFAFGYGSTTDPSTPMTISQDEKGHLFKIAPDLYSRLVHDGHDYLKKVGGI